LKSIKTYIFEYFLYFCAGASWGLFVVWIIFPPLRLFTLFIDRILWGGLSLSLAFCLTFLLDKITKND